MTPIKLIDAPTGAGKTTALIHTLCKAFNTFKETGSRFIILTPYLDEVSRYIAAFAQRGIEVDTPTGTKGTKGTELINLIQQGKNIIGSHALLQCNYVRLMEALSSSETPYKYSLYIDEEPSIIMSELMSENDPSSNKGLFAPVSSLSFADLNLMVDKGLIALKAIPAETREVYAIKGITTSPKGAPSVLASFVPFFLYNNVYWIGEKGNQRQGCLLPFFPATFWKLFDTVSILSYRLKYSFFYFYCKLFELSVSFYHINADMTAFEEGYKELKPSGLHRLHIKDVKGLDRLKGSLSYSWYSKAPKEALKTVKGIMLGITRDYSSSTLLWTTFKGVKGKLKDKNHGLSDKNFLAHNATATNDYKDKTTIIYGLNKYLNPIMKGYWEALGQHLNNDQYALSSLIQFIWRSNIRDTGSNKPIDIYFLSNRMRNLFTTWLSE